jgi:hypothetical protein
VTEQTATATDAAAGAMPATAAETAVSPEAQTAWNTFEAAEKPADSSKATESDTKPASTEGAAASQEGATAKPEAKATETAQTSEQDIWATATPEQKAELQKLQAEAATARAEFKRMAGTVSGMSKKIDALDKQVKAAATPAQQEGAAEATEDFFATKEWKAFAEEYPQLAEKQAAAWKPLLGKFEKVEKNLKGITDERTDQQISDDYAAVLADHDDYPDIKGSQELINWIHANSDVDFIQDAIKRNEKVIVRPKEVSRLIKMFKEDTGWKPKAKTEGQAGGQGQDKGQKPADGQQAEGTSQTQAREQTRAETRREAQLEASASPRTEGQGAVTDAAPNDEKKAWDYFERKGL